MAVKGSRLPERWVPFPADEAFARDLGLDVDRVTDTFRDYWRAQPGQKGVKLDWSATWRNWCRRDAERPPPKRTSLDWTDTDPLFGGRA